MNVGKKRKSPEQALTIAEGLTLILPWGAIGNR